MVVPCGANSSCPPPEFDIGNIAAETGLEAKVVTGIDIYDVTSLTQATDEVVTVKVLLGPLMSEDVPILRCVGLNYEKHNRFCAPRVTCFTTRAELPQSRSLQYTGESTHRRHKMTFYWLTIPSSSGGGSKSTAIPVHFLQAQYDSNKPRGKRGHPQDRSRQATRLRGRILSHNRKGRQKCA